MPERFPGAMSSSDRFLTSLLRARLFSKTHPFGHSGLSRMARSRLRHEMPTPQKLTIFEISTWVLPQPRAIFRPLRLQRRSSAVPSAPKTAVIILSSSFRKYRTAVASFDGVPTIRLISIWAPQGELRVNDVFVLGGHVREAIPSTKLGLVPSGNWKQWASLEKYLATLQVPQAAVNDLAQQMLAIGLSALVRETFQTRLVGVGVGDNESGLLFLRAGASPPRVGDVRPDGNTYTLVEQVDPGVWFYETS